jgi:hypothetical protein
MTKIWGSSIHVYHPWSKNNPVRAGSTASTGAPATPGSVAAGTSASAGSPSEAEGGPVHRDRARYKWFKSFKGCAIAKKNAKAPAASDGNEYDDTISASTNPTTFGFSLPKFSFEKEPDTESVGEASSGKGASKEVTIPPGQYGLPEFSFEADKTGDFNFDFEKLRASLVFNNANFTTGDISPAIFGHPPFNKRKYLTRYELADLMPSGPDAEKRSGVVVSHIDPLKYVASKLDVALAFRKVNPAAKYWIQHDFPVKGLSVKNKSEKTGPLQGLLLTIGKSGGAVEALDGKLLGAKLEEMISNDELEMLENSAEEEADPTHYVLNVRDKKTKHIYKMKFNVKDSTFSVSKLDGDEFRPVKFKGLHGKPLTADYDAFDFYPRLKNKNFAGFKDIDTKAIEQPTPHFADLAYIAWKQVLELPKVRKMQQGLGRLNNWDAHIITTCNDEIKKQSGYLYDVVMHGKEKRNTEFPELCNEVFFIFPDGQTLMSTSWEQTQAIDHAIKQEGFVSTDNRTYNSPAGSEVRFHDQKKGSLPAIPPASGKTIKWDSRAAAEKLYDGYKKFGKSVAAASFGLSKKSAGKIVAGSSSSSSGSDTHLTIGGSKTLHGKRPTSMTSIASIASTTSTHSIPPWLTNLVTGASAAGISTPSSGNGTSPHVGAGTVPLRLLRVIRELSEDNSDDLSNDGEKS